MNVLELNAETILDGSIFDYIFSESNLVERERIVQEIMDRAKMLGVKGKFDNLYVANKAMHKKEEKMQVQQGAIEILRQRKAMREVAMTNFSNSKYPDLLCGAWECDDFGVRTFNMLSEVIACYHPIIPVKRLVNLETHKEKMIIAFNKDGYWKEQVFDKSILLSANKIVNAMSDFGILASSENAKYLVRYFAEIESLNINRIPIQKSTSKMGWINGTGQFMPYTDNTIVFDSESSFQSLFSSISQKGNKQKYIDFLKKIRSYNRKEPMFCVAASLASTLVKPCGSLPFIFHLYGEAGKGKTISLMLAASIWGSPDENGYMADPKSTKTAFEMRLNFLNNLPFICDDMAQVKQSFGKRHGDFSDFIYLVCSGKGNERSNINLGLNTITTWKNSSITSGERPITTEISQGGELLRVIEYQTEPGNIFEKSRYTADFLRTNYGHIGLEFIRILQNIGNDIILSMYEEFTGLLHKMDTLKEKEGKQINSMALILTADKILTDYIIQDGIYLNIQNCFDLIKSNKQMSDNERAYEFVCNEINIHKKKFMKGDYEPEQRWGYFYDGYVLINPNIFSEISERGNFNKKMFVEWAVKNGLSQVDNEKGRFRTTKKVNNATAEIKGNFVFIKLDSEVKQMELIDNDTIEDIYYNGLPFD